MPYDSLFSDTPATFVDTYALTMAQADFASGDQNRISTSQVFFRQLLNNGFKDFQGKDLKVPYMVVAGLGPFFEWLDNWKFDDKTIAKLAKLKAAGTHEPLFTPEFLAALKDQKIEVSIEAIPEGDLAFPDEPIVRLTGPHWQVQMLEGAILNAITAQTGWATVASQFWLAAQTLTKRATLVEFGLRRNSEWGGLGAARSAYLAGWDGTSNVYAATTYDIPPAGTMAHAYIMVRENEVDAFATWAKNMPHLGVFLVDTYDTEQGIRNAIAACKKAGIKLRGIRLDSGDMKKLSRVGRDILNEAGFKDAVIMASDSLNIRTVHQLYQVDGAPLDSMGIGGNYVTRRQDTEGVSAVMKAAVADGRDLMKFSETPDKATIPGALDIIRTLEPQKFGDAFFGGDILVPRGMDVGDGKLSRELVAIPRNSLAAVQPYPAGTKFYRPMIPFTDKGRHLLPEYQAQDAPAILAKSRSHFMHSMKQLHDALKEIAAPASYEVGLEESLHTVRTGRIRANEAAQKRAAQASRFLEPAIAA